VNEMYRFYLEGGVNIRYYM